MSHEIVFIQVHGRPGIIEAKLAEVATLGALHKALADAGIDIDAETFIFIDEMAEPLRGDHHHPVDCKQGSRVHVTRCRHIKTTVHFLDKTREHEFPPGVRVRGVKAWAVHAFGLNPKDGAEHVLQICKSTARPVPDTPLHELVEGHGCALCFDLVPEKRVEG